MISEGSLKLTNTLLKMDRAEFANNPSLSLLDRIVTNLLYIGNVDEAKTFVAEHKSEVAGDLLWLIRRIATRCIKSDGPQAAMAYYQSQTGPEGLHEAVNLIRLINTYPYWTKTVDGETFYKRVTIEQALTDKTAPLHRENAIAWIEHYIAPEAQQRAIDLLDRRIVTVTSLQTVSTKPVQESEAKPEERTRTRDALRAKFSSSRPSSGSLRGALRNSIKHYTNQ